MGYILIKPKVATEEYNTENADEQDQSATCHLKNGNGCIEEANIHQLDEIKLDKVRLKYFFWGGNKQSIETNGGTN